MPKLSIITASFNSDIYVRKYLKSISRIAKKITKSFELIIVDDGSSIKSRQNLLKFSKKYKSLKIVFLKRNFGQAISFYEGIKLSSGKFFYTTDIDLEVDPKTIFMLHSKIIKKKKNCIFCINNNDNSKSILEKLLKFIFFRFAKIFLKNSWLLLISSTFMGSADCRKQIEKINFDNKNLSLLIFKLIKKDFIKIDRNLIGKKTSYTYKKRFEIAFDFLKYSFTKKKLNKTKNRILKIIN